MNGFRILHCGFIAFALIGLSFSPLTFGEDNIVIFSNDQGLNLTLGGSYRIRFESWRDGDVIPDSREPLGARTSAWRKGYDDDYFLTNLKIHLNADLSQSWRVYVEGEYAELVSSARIDGNRRYDSKLHLQQAYIEYDDFVNRLKLGRQTLDYGSRIVLGTNTWFNNTISYDVARFDHVSQSFDASAFAGVEVFEPHDQDFEYDQVVGGYHLTFRPGGWHLEQYSFYKEHDRKNRAEDLSVGSIGARVLNSWDKYDLDVDVIQQIGERDGWASHGMFTRYINPGHWTQLRVFAAYNIASGGSTPGDDNNYLPFNPAGHLDRQSTDYAPYINLREYGFGMLINPLKDQPLLVRLSWFDMYKFNKNGPIYTASPDLVVWAGSAADHRAKSRLGHHINLFASYRIEKTNTDFSTCLTRYFIEDAIEDFGNTRDDTTFFYLAVTQHF